MGQLYDHVNDVTKTVLKKSIGKLLDKIEATLNSTPLIYLNDKMNDQVFITPVYVLSINVKNGFRQIGDKDEKYDPDYHDQSL